MQVSISRGRACALCTACALTVLVTAGAMLSAGTTFAASDSGVSVADTLDSRAPVVDVTDPLGGELFNSGNVETVSCTVDEDSWGSVAEPVQYWIKSGADVLSQGTLAVEGDGNYSWTWNVPYLAETPTDAHLIVAGTDRFGWAAADTSAVFSIQDLVTDAPLPLAIDRLKSVFPNPFNPSTTITFSLKSTAHVSLDVYDVRGHKVTTLADKNMASGDHEVVWLGRDSNGHSVPSGTYFARLSLEGSDRNNSFVTRMTLVK